MISAQRITSSTGPEMYHVGNVFIAWITKEQYDEILSYGKETEIEKGLRYITHMDNHPKHIIAKYAQIVYDKHNSTPLSVLENNIKRMESELHMKKLEFDRLQELVILKG